MILCSFPLAYNTQELEECDYGGGETCYLSAFDRQELTFHSQSSISSNHVRNNKRRHLLLASNTSASTKGEISN